VTRFSLRRLARVDLREHEDTILLLPAPWWG
jgi:hypothetical protein